MDALQVNEEKRFTSIIQKNIHNSNVYPLGISGMPISGYLEVRRAIKDILQPDLIIYLIVDNDFSESLFGNHMVSFSDKSRLNLMYGVETGENKEVKLTEFPSRPFKRHWLDKLLREFAFVRYIVLNTTIYKKFFTEKTKKENSNSVKKNINIDEIVTKYTFSQLSKLDNVENIIVAYESGSRGTIYLNQERSKFNRERSTMLRKECEQLGIQFIDLYELFKDEFKISNNRFEFKHDAHWNEYAHRLVGEYLSDHLKSR